MNERVNERVTERVTERAGESWKPAPTAYDDRADDVRAPQWEEAVAASAGVATLVPAADPATGAAADAPLAPDEISGNLARYARYQWRDFWQRRGFWLAGAAAFGVWLLTWLARHAGPANGPMPIEAITAMAHAAFAVGGGLAGLLGTGGLVARERERGLQRFLFAKPVHIVRYYLQGLAVNAAGSLLVVLGAVLLTALVFAPAVPVLTVFAVGAAAYALTSGVTFLVSTLLRFDAPLAAGWLLAGFPVVAFAENGHWWAKVLQWLFPQAPMLALAKAWLPGGPGPDAFTPQVAVALVLAAAVAATYGAVAAAGGVAVLRRRAIQT